MLSKFDVEACVYKSLKHFVDRTQQQINTKQSQNLFLLVDLTNRLIATSKDYSSVKSFATVDKKVVNGFWNNNMGTGNYPDVSFLRSQSWKMQLNASGTNWVENLNFNSTEELTSYILINQKVFTLELVNSRIDYERTQHTSYLPLQNIIYFSKYLEAKEILSLGIDNDDTLKYPYTTGYANLKGLTLQEAAKRICMKHDFQSGYLAEVETLRMKYKDLICDETDIKNLKPIIENFNKEVITYGQIG